MELSDVISGLKLNPNERLALVAVLKGFNQVARIDIFSGEHDSPEKVRQTLRSVGLKFCNLVVTTGRKDHLCGMAVARTEDLAVEFKTANEAGDRATMRRLVGEFIISPEVKTNDYSYIKKVREILKEVPMVFLEMILKPYPAVN